MKENKYDEAKSIFKKGADKGQQFCLHKYIYLLLSSIDYNQLLTNYNLISHNLKNILILVCLYKLNHGSAYYMYYYLIKHSSFRQQIQKIFLNTL